jgi:hypothetical protein
MKLFSNVTLKNGATGYAVKNLKYNGVLVRFMNNSGQPYSCIITPYMETVCVPRSDERRMRDDWERGNGRKWANTLDEHFGQR